MSFDDGDKPGRRDSTPLTPVPPWEEGVTVVSEAPTAITDLIYGTAAPMPNAPAPIRIRPAVPTLEELADDSTGDVDVHGATRVQDAPAPHTLVMDPYLAGSASAPAPGVGSPATWGQGAYAQHPAYAQAPIPLGGTAPLSPQQQSAFPTGGAYPPPTVGLPMAPQQPVAPQFAQFAQQSPPTFGQQLQTLPLYAWALIGVGGGLVLLLIVAGALYFLLTRN